MSESQEHTYYEELKEQKLFQPATFTAHLKVPLTNGDCPQLLIASVNT